MFFCLITSTLHFIPILLREQRMESNLTYFFINEKGWKKKFKEGKIIWMNDSRKDGKKQNDHEMKRLFM